MENIRTHLKIDRSLCGKPIQIKNGNSSVELLTTAVMAADDTGLVHGGFVFGLADYAAMLAVNHPNVVLGSAEVQFQKPVRVGDTIRANASIQSVSGKKLIVDVLVLRDDTVVFRGQFNCFVLDKHVLD